MKAVEITVTPLGRREVKRKAPNKIWSTARSLKPGEWLCYALAHPQPAASFLAIRDAWKPKFKPTLVTQAQWDHLILHHSHFSECNSVLYAPEAVEFEEAIEAEYKEDLDSRQQIYSSVVDEAQSN